MSTFQKFIVGIGGAVCLLLIFIIVFTFTRFAVTSSMNLRTSGWGGYPASVNEGLNVEGTAVVRTPPDLAVTQIGVTSKAYKAAIAIKTNTAKVKRIVKVLNSYGIKAKDIQTYRYSLYPVLDNYGRFKHYQVSNFVQLKIRDLEKVGEILDGVVKGGATHLEEPRWRDIRFMVEDIKEARKRARELAVKNAKDRAEQIASALGAKLGEIISVTETTAPDGYGYYYRYPYREHVTAQQAVTIPASYPEEEVIETGIAPGVVEVTARVRVIFEVKA